ncbi:MAG: serine/threonine protein kinase [Bdellovibrionales bacterium]|nr:serine/threonine protein kinase [Bdellovibrionales bacterium]
MKKASVFDVLTPDFILGAVEAKGFKPTGEIIQLNSYENRVFDIKVEPHELVDETAGPRPAIIAKFYRPGRWSKESVQDEHEFLMDLRAEGIPAIAPFDHAFQYDGFLTALFPKRSGRMPQEFMPGELEQVGRLLARLHNVGAKRPAPHRPTLDAETYGYAALDRLERVVYPELWYRYEDAALTICEYLEDELNPDENIRIHGDCHKGNLLQMDTRLALTPGGSAPASNASGSPFFFVDFDDCCNGPPVQDFFMLLSGASDHDDQAKRELEALLKGYDELRTAPDNLYLLEALRGLRIIHYAGWIAARWADPFFPSLFPGFHSYNWWAEECLRIEQIAAAL